MTISKERKLELQAIAERRHRAPMSQKLHDLAVKVNAGTANKYERGLCRRMMEDGSIPKGDYPPEWLNNEEEVAYLQYCTIKLSNMAAIGALEQAEAERDAIRLERDAAEERRSAVFRENLVLNVKGKRKDELSKQFSMLGDEERHVVNLWIRHKSAGAKRVWSKISAEYRKAGKKKTYTDERCRQLFIHAMKQSPSLKQLLGGLVGKTPVIPKPSKGQAEPTDHEEIERLTTQQAGDSREFGKALTVKSTDHRFSPKFGKKKKVEKP